MNICINKEYDAGHTENYEKIKLITNMYQETKFVFTFIFGLFSIHNKGTIMYVYK